MVEKGETYTDQNFEFTYTVLSECDRGQYYCLIQYRNIVDRDWLFADEFTKLILILPSLN